MSREFRECLACGQARIWIESMSHAAADECPRCGYLGWAPPKSLTEPMRRALREQPPQQRRAASS